MGEKIIEFHNSQALTDAARTNESRKEIRDAARGYYLLE